MSITLLQLIKDVKEQNLPKDKLEEYRDQMSTLYAEMCLEMSELEKAEALFMGGFDKEVSNVARKTEWKNTAEGQRIIVLKWHLKALEKLLSSLKNRIFQIY